MVSGLALPKRIHEQSSLPEHAFQAMDRVVVSEEARLRGDQIIEDGIIATTDVARGKFHGSQGVAQGVAVDFGLGAKCWSEWQDLNLRPPRPEQSAPLSAP